MIFRSAFLLLTTLFFASATQASLLYYNFVGQVTQVGNVHGLMGERNVSVGDTFQAIYTIDSADRISGGSNSLSHANVEYDDAILNIKYYANGHLFADTYNRLQRLFFANGLVNFKKTDFMEAHLQLSPGYDEDGWGLTGAGEWASSYLYLADSTGSVFDYLLGTKTFDNLIPLSLNIDDFSYGYMDFWLNSENDRKSPGYGIRGDIVDIRSDNTVLPARVSEPAALVLMMLGAGMIYLRRRA